LQPFQPLIKGVAQTVWAFHLVSRICGFWKGYQFIGTIYRTITTEVRPSKFNMLEVSENRLNGTPPSVFDLLDLAAPPLFKMMVVTK